MPRRSLAQEAVERFGLLQVHGFPAPAHVGLKTKKTGNADPATGLAKLAAPGELRRAAGRLLVAGTPVRDLLLAPNICSSLPPLDAVEPGSSA